MKFCVPARCASDVRLLRRKTRRRRPGRPTAECCRLASRDADREPLNYRAGLCSQSRAHPHATHTSHTYRACLGVAATSRVARGHCKALHLGTPPPHRMTQASSAAPSAAPPPRSCAMERSRLCSRRHSRKRSAWFGVMRTRVMSVFRRVGGIRRISSHTS